MAAKHPAGSVRTQLIDAATDLFTRWGVHGTSLQMLADHVGVTKAAVYYHFQSKEDLIDAAVTPYMRRLAEVVVAAESRRGRTARVDTLLDGLIDLMVDARRQQAALQFDPTIQRHLDGRPDMKDLRERVGLLMIGPDLNNHSLVITLILSGGLAFATGSPYLAHVDDDQLRRDLYTAARRILGIRTPIAEAPRP
ncbi:helix-turn-helix domain-containing protein [Actinocorallia longicatena]|uniref:TetR family transcriptional regulator n=1 Tax=Actinocorallia longicatena TaxID=111803 RepID=A0ABP6Q6L5_9ACTN